MTTQLWMVIAVLALLAGAGIGWAVGAGRARGEVDSRVRRAEQQAKEELARAEQRVAAEKARADKAQAEANAQWQARMDRLNADHRAETEKLSRHMTEAYDELDRLRVQLASAGPPQPPDTGQGFAATMPMPDL